MMCVISSHQSLSHRCQVTLYLHVVLMMRKQEKSDGGVDEKAEAEYQKLLTKFKQDLGIVDDKSK